MGKYTVRVHDHLVLPARVLLPRDQAEVQRLLARPVPSAVSIHLVIDTGSKRSSLIPGIIRHLNLMRAGEANVETSLATGQASLFWARLEFPGTGLEPIGETLIARLNLPPSLASFHGLIGRDLLHHWESSCYQGRRGRLTIRDRDSWPLRWFR